MSAADQNTPLSVQQRVVRKRLEDDCLLDNQVHPSIAERLERIRELPVGNVANLRAVERDSDGIWLVWQFIDGMTWEEFFADSEAKPKCQEMIAQVRRSVTAMHAHGIVHGAIHPRNIIIDRQARPYLTHISPLLWNDPEQDEQAIAALEADFHVRHATGIDDKSSDDKYLRSKLYFAAAIAFVAGILIFLSILWYIHE